MKKICLLILVTIMLCCCAEASVSIDPAEAQAGDCVLFGRYEQDGDATNGPEPIQWLVLNRTDDTLLLVSLYGLDTQPYHIYDAPVTWATCSLRAWLADSFLPAAFTAQEQSRLVPRIKHHHDYAADLVAQYNKLVRERDQRINQWQKETGADYSKVLAKQQEADKAFFKEYGFLPMNFKQNAVYWVTSPDTTDLVFLLCSDDVNEYKDSIDVRPCEITAYVRGQGSTEVWWAGTPNYVYTTDSGRSDFTQAGAYDYRDPDNVGLILVKVQSSGVAVRPAIQLRIR